MGIEFKCDVCDVIKPIADFTKHPRMSSGYRKTCKVCTAFYYQLRRYHMSIDDYNALLEFQDHGCAICGALIGAVGRKLSVDHDHNCCEGQFSCGKCIRGLLCQNCNSGLGQFHDDVGLLARAISYLEGNR